MLFLRPADSQACTPPYCWGGFFLPGSGQVPANVVAIKWWPYYKSWLAPIVDESNVTILQVSGSEELPVPFTIEDNDDRTYLLRLDEDLVPGSEYILRCDDQYREEEPIETRFTAYAPAALPSEIGTLQVSDPRIEVITVATISGSCDTDITAAVVDIELQHADSAIPWINVLDYETLVDGERWAASASLAGSPDWAPGGSWMGRGGDRIYVLCAADDSGAQPGVEEGDHTVQMEATMPGRDEVLRTNSVSHPVLRRRFPGRSGGRGYPGA